MRSFPHSFFGLFFIYLRGPSVGKFLVPAVIPERIRAVSAHLSHGGEFVEVDVFVFDGPPEPLDEDVFEGAASSVQVDARPTFSRIWIQSALVNSLPWSLL